MNINKKTIIIISVILLLVVAFLGIKNNKKEDTGKINIKGNNVKIVANEISKIELEEYKNDALTMKKPKDWKVTSAGTGMYYAISIFDEKNPINKIFLMLKIQPLLKSDASKKYWQNYASLSKSDQYKIFSTAVVLNNPTTKEFYTKFNDITSYLNNLDATYNNVNFPQLNELNVIEETELNSNFKSIALDDKILRATFKGKNDLDGEGMFSASIVNFGDNYMNGIDTTYYMIYNIMSITSEKDKFIDYKDLLLESINSIEFTDTYVKKTIDDGNAQTKQALELNRQIQQAFDSYMSAWEKRSKTYDIMSQKQSDATLGYERVYDTDTGEIYKAYNGFTDDYDGQKYKSISEEMYTEKTSGYIEKD